MQCNQSLCGNGFTNGPIYSCNNSPLQCCQNMYPEVVGEGEVTSVTLSDGTVQFFFMPTIKWWAPNASQCYPTLPNPMFANTNYNNPHCNNNVGTWFVRSISNPLPQNTFSLPCQRSEVPRLCCHSDYNMNSSNCGYQLKFHNDNWTSTTDLHYFCPSLRQRDYVVKPSCKGAVTVPVQTEPVANNAVCHHEVLCSKPCNCNVCPKPMSLVSIVEPNLTTKCNSGSTNDYSRDNVCTKHKRDNTGKKGPNKPKITCGCVSKDKIITSEKSVTTYVDEGSGNCIADGRQTQTCKLEKLKPCCKKEVPQNSCEKSRPLPKTSDRPQKCQIIKAETWLPKTSLSKKAIARKSSEKLKRTSDRESNDGCSSTCSCSSG